MTRPLQLLILLTAACLTGCAMPRYTVGLDEILIQKGRDVETAYKYPCTRGAHRGSSEDHKENTMAALIAADRDNRFAFIEFDIQYTKDKKIVLFHDTRMLRTFGSLRKVGNTTYPELLTITQGDITTYYRVIPILKKRLNIEIKSQGDEKEDEQLVDELMADLRERIRDGDVLISSISEEVVKYVNLKYPEIPTGQIFWLKSSTYLPFDGLTKKLYDDIAESEADYLMLHIANLRNIDDLMALKPKGKTVVFWDFDDKMYVVHKDLSDRVWGDFGIGSFFRLLRYKCAALFR
jgi:glycerophosphoryl diester phosphodiesterase